MNRAGVIHRADVLVAGTDGDIGFPAAPAEVTRSDCEAEAVALLGRLGGRADFNSDGYADLG
jgi:hypothetical protein